MGTRATPKEEKSHQRVRPGAHRFGPASPNTEDRLGPRALSGHKSCRTHTERQTVGSFVVCAARPTSRAMRFSARQPSRQTSTAQHGWPEEAVLSEKIWLAQRERSRPAAIALINHTESCICASHAGRRKATSAQAREALKTRLQADLRKCVDRSAGSFILHMLCTRVHTTCIRGSATTLTVVRRSRRNAFQKSHFWFYHCCVRCTVLCMLIPVSAVGEGGHLSAPDSCAV